MTYAWDSMIIGLMTGEIEASMAAQPNVTTTRFRRLTTGYAFVKRGAVYHIRAVGSGSAALCGCCPLAKEEDSFIQRVADVCPACDAAFTEDN